MNKLIIPTIAVSLALIGALAAPAKVITEPQSQQVAQPAQVMKLNPLPQPAEQALIPDATNQPASPDDTAPAASDPTAAATQPATTDTTDQTTFPDPSGCSNSSPSCFEVVGTGNPLPN